MRFTFLGTLIVACTSLLLVMGCSQTNSPTAFDTSEAQVLTKKIKNFRAHLSSDEEVHPVDSDAQGQAIFQLNKAGDALSYKLIVANIEDVVQAHIHVGASGANGPVVAFLYGFSPPGGPINGVLAQGTIVDVDVIPQPGFGFPGGLDALITEMTSGNTYVNVHTTANPPGEVRGQIR